MNYSKEERMANGSLPGLILAMSIPSVIAQVINVLYNIVDRIYIGHIPGVGAAALTGVGLTFPVTLLVSAFSAFASAGVRLFLPSGWEKGTENVQKRFLEAVCGCCWYLLQR